MDIVIIIIIITGLNTILFHIFWHHFSEPERAEISSAKAITIKGMNNNNMCAVAMQRGRECLSVNMFFCFIYFNRIIIYISTYIVSARH